MPFETNMVCFFLLLFCKTCNKQIDKTIVAPMQSYYTSSTNQFQKIAIYFVCWLCFDLTLWLNVRKSSRLQHPFTIIFIDEIHTTIIVFKHIFLLSSLIISLVADVPFEHNSSRTATYEYNWRSGGTIISEKKKLVDTGEKC